MGLESSFQPEVIAALEELFPKAVIFKTDPNTIQGFPDLIILQGKKWAALETKRARKSSHRPNQDYYVDLLGKMSYAAFVNPANLEKVLREVQNALRP